MHKSLKIAVTSLVLSTIFFPIYFSQIHKKIEHNTTPKTVDPYIYGDLGGLNVKLPINFVELVQLNEDQKNDTKNKKENETSKKIIRSLGIEVFYKELEQEKITRTSKLNRKSEHESQFIYIGLISGEHFPKDNFMNNYTKLIDGYLFRMGGKDGFPYPTSTFRRTQEMVHGLVAYELFLGNPSIGAYKKIKETNDLLFLDINSQNQVSTFITCSTPTRSDGLSTCRMRYSLEPKAKIVVSARFFNNHLKDWRIIKKKTADMIYSFSNEN